jgi:type II secretory pathway component GspD/PulD (secretin)
MLEERGNTEILSSPNIVTTDNNMAKIHVGQTVPIPNYTYNDERGVWVVADYTKQAIGITLEVTPRIVNNDNIILDIHPSISGIIGYTGPNNERPITSVREAETQVKLRSGEVIMIGGLLKEEEIDSVKRVPGLGRIPVLGLLFTKKVKRKEKTDLLIFVSAEILK